MKKKLLFCLFFCLVMFNVKVDALCYDNDLNSWANDVKIKFVDFDRDLINEETGKPLKETMLYAYILTPSVQRKDIVIQLLEK